MSTLTRGDAEYIQVEPDEVEPERRASVALDAIVAERRRHAREHRRPSALTAREALAVLEFDALLVWTAAHNQAVGVELSQDDRARLTVACRNISAIVGEVA